MKLAGIFLLLAVLLPSLALSDQGAKAEAEKLLSVMEMESLLDDSINQMLDIQMQQNPAMVPYRAVMLSFFQKYMSYESLKPDLVRIYSDAFTAAELRDLNTFYATETGKKSIKQVPRLTAQGAMLGTSRVQDNMAELQRMIAEESERLQALQGQ